MPHQSGLQLQLRAGGVAKMRAQFHVAAHWMWVEPGGAQHTNAVHTQNPPSALVETNQASRSNTASNSQLIVITGRLLEIADAQPICIHSIAALWAEVFSEMASLRKGRTCVDAQVYENAMSPCNTGRSNTLCLRRRVSASQSSSSSLS